MPSSPSSPVIVAAFSGAGRFADLHWRCLWWEPEHKLSFPDPFPPSIPLFVSLGLSNLKTLARDHRSRHSWLSCPCPATEPYQSRGLRSMASHARSHLSPTPTRRAARSSIAWGKRFVTQIQICSSTRLPASSSCAAMGYSSVMYDKEMDDQIRPAKVPNHMIPPGSDGNLRPISHITNGSVKKGAFGRYKQKGEEQLTKLKRPKKFYRQCLASE